MRRGRGTAERRNVKWACFKTRRPSPSHRPFPFFQGPCGSLWLPPSPTPLPLQEKRLGPSVFGASLLRVFSLALFLTNPAARLALLYPNRATL